MPDDQLSPQDFAAKVRAKYPGSYDGIPDMVLTQKVLAKYPEYGSSVKMPTAGLPKSPAPQPGYVQSLGRSLGAPTTPQEAATLVSDPSGNYPGTPQQGMYNAVANMGRGVATGVRQGIRQFPEAIRNISEGGPVLANIGKAASGYTDVLSSLNPVIAAGGQAGQQASQGNYRGAAGSAAGGMLSGAAMLGAAEPTTLRAQPKAYAKPAAVEAVTNAVNPAAKDMPGFRTNLANNLDYASQYADTKGIPINGREGLSKAMAGAGDELHTFFKKNYIDPIARTEVKAPQGFAGQTVSSGGSILEPVTTVGDLYGRLKTINATLYPKYQKGSAVAVNAGLSAENSVALTAEANAIRSTLYRDIGDKLGIDPAKVGETNARAGSLMRQAEEVQLSADKERHAFNTEQQRPVTLETSLTGLGVRSAQKGIRRMIGSTADRQISNVFSNYQGTEITRPSGRLTIGGPVPDTNSFSRTLLPFLEQLRKTGTGQ